MCSCQIKWFFRRYVESYCTQNSYETHLGKIFESTVQWIILCVLHATLAHLFSGNDSNLLIVFYVQIMPDDFVMQLHRF